LFSKGSSKIQAIIRLRPLGNIGGLRNPLNKLQPQKSKPLVLLILNGGDHAQSSFADKRNGYVFASRTPMDLVAWTIKLC
jgi:hypothetical protein